MTIFKNLIPNCLIFETYTEITLETLKSVLNFINIYFVHYLKFSTYSFKFFYKGTDFLKNALFLC